MKCFLCHGEKPEADLISRKDKFGEIKVCRSCFEDSMNGDFSGIETRRQLEELKLRMVRS